MLVVVASSFWLASPPARSTASNALTPGEESRDYKKSISMKIEAIRRKRSQEDRPPPVAELTEKQVPPTTQIEYVVHDVTNFFSFFRVLSKARPQRHATQSNRTTELVHVTCIDVLFPLTKKSRAML